MGMIISYFTAPTAADAAAVLVHPNGPAGGASMTNPPAWMFWKEPELVPSPTPSYRTLDGGGIEPVVQMATLESILTGVDTMEIIGTLADPLAQNEGAIIVQLRPTLVAALAELRADDLPRIAEQWAATEEFWGQADPATLAAFITALAARASSAHGAGQGVYCWVSM